METWITLDVGENTTTDQVLKLCVCAMNRSLQLIFFSYKRTASEN